MPNTKPNRDITAVDMADEVIERYIVRKEAPLQDILLDVLAQALTKQKEEIVKSLRMEMIAHDGDNRGCEDCAYNNAVDEFNQKLDTLLK